MPTLSRHAELRMAQRGVTEEAIETILAHGASTRDGVILRRREVGEVIAALRAEIRELERLRDKFVVLADDTVITCYTPGRRKMKRVLRTLA